MSQPQSSELPGGSERPPPQARCLTDDYLQRQRLGMQDSPYIFSGPVLTSPDWPPHTPRLLRDAILVTEANSSGPFISSSAGVKNVLNRIATLCTDTQHPNLYLDLEGNSHKRTGTISILQLYVEPLNEVYLFDINALGASAISTSTDEALCLKNMLQDGKIKKAFFDPRQVSAALYALYGIKLQGVIDVQVMHCAVTDPTKCVLSFKKCIAELPLKDEELHAVKEVKDKGHSLYKDNDGAVFDERPLPIQLLQYCIEDVVLLAALYKQCEPKMTPNLWHNCNNVFRIRLETSLAPNCDVNPKSSKYPWSLHEKGNLKGLPMHDTIDWYPSGENTALDLRSSSGWTPDRASRQKRDDQKTEESGRSSPTVLNTSPASRNSQQKQGHTMMQGGACETRNFTDGDEDSGYDFEDCLLMGRSLPTQGNRLNSAFDLEMSLFEEATDASAQRARAQTSFNSSDPLNSSFFNLSISSISETPQMLPPHPSGPSQSNLSPLAASFHPQHGTDDGNISGSSVNQALKFSYYPGQTRMLDSSFDQSMIRAPTPQPDFSHPSPERRVSLTRRPAAMDGIAQAFRDEQLYSDTASLDTGGVLTSSSSSAGSGGSDQVSDSSSLING